MPCFKQRSGLLACNKHNSPVSCFYPGMLQDACLFAWLQIQTNRQVLIASGNYTHAGGVSRLEEGRANLFG